MNDTVEPEPQPKRSMHATTKAVDLIVLKYRQHYHILDHEVLTEEEIDQILEGVRTLIYKQEGIWHSKK